MDRLTALVAIAHLKLRLEVIQRNPQLLEALDMNRTIKRPIELAGFAGRLIRAEKIETDLAVTGERYDTVLADDRRPARGVALACRRARDHARRSSTRSSPA
jgi:hypothetical protein